jgi:hypothetical protein
LWVDIEVCEQKKIKLGTIIIKIIVEVLIGVFFTMIIILGIERKRRKIKFFILFYNKDLLENDKRIENQALEMRDLF